MGRSKVSEEDKQALRELVVEEVEAHRRGEIERLTTSEELSTLIGVAGVTIKRYLSDLPLNLRNYRANQITHYFCERNARDLSHRRKSSERLKELNQDEEFKREKSGRSRKVMFNLHNDPRFIESMLRGVRKLHNDPLFKKRLKKRARIQGLKNAEAHRKNAYHIENRFYASSQQEGAVALLLEKYIPSYRVEEGKTFQVRGNGITNGGIDFWVGDEFLEWHPIILTDYRRGDIPSREERNSYKKVLESLPEREQKRFQQDYKKVLEVNYRNKRQEAVDNSGYAGANVALAKNISELYNFMSKYSGNLPSRENFKTEFNQMIRYVKSCKVQKDTKVEAA